MVCSVAADLPAEALQPNALRAAQQRGATELGCPAATADVMSKKTIEEPQATGWYEPPHRAAYTVAVAGCGKHTNYSVACDDRKSCVAGAVSTASSSPPPAQLADTMQPDAVWAAQGRASSALGCPSVRAEVLTKETIQEAQITGWYEAPHRAEYTIGVSGCGKRVTR
jgi:predicted metal-binding protein